MCARVAIVYNEPIPSRYSLRGEDKAVFGVLESVEAVHKSLLELGYNVVKVPLVPPIEEADKKLRSLDVRFVFNLFEGFCGQPETEALVPEILSGLDIPCTGCTADILTLGLNKPKTKALLEAAGIATPRYQVLEPDNISPFRLSFPCIVKPCAEDASHGVSAESVVHDIVSLERQVRVVSNSYGGKALVEEFIDGREFNAAVLGNSKYRVFPVSEIDYSLPPGMPKVLTIAAKWETDNNIYAQGTNVTCPAKLDIKDIQRISEMVIAVFRLLKCRGYARVDMRLDKAERLNVLEVNPNPDISPGSGAARQAEAAGMTYTQFVEMIIQLALKK